MVMLRSAATEGYICVFGPTVAGVWVDVHIPCCHQKPYRLIHMVFVYKKQFTVKDRYNLKVNCGGICLKQMEPKPSIYHDSNIWKKIKPKVTEGIKNVTSNRESTQKILIRDDSRAQACGRRMGNPGSQRMKSGEDKGVRDCFHTPKT